MGFLAVILAGVAAWIWGAIWYMVMAKPWMAAAGVEVGEDGRPANASNPVPYIVSLIAVIVVAGMTRHVFALSGIDTAWEGIVSGFGIGAFLVLPWLATNYGFSGRPVQLTLIDGAYATIGCTVIGFVLTLFA